MTKGECMRNARLKQGMTIMELSHKTGINRNVIGRLEKDMYGGNISTIEMLADALHISIDEYIGHEVV